MPRSPQHYATTWGSTFLTWRLHASNRPLSAMERQLVLDVILTGEGVLGHIRAAVVMDDHVHVLAKLRAEVTIQRSVQTWKSVSAHRLVKEMNRVAPVWQRSYFDRSPTSPDAIARCVEYILSNPRRRWPHLTSYPWAHNGGPHSGPSLGG